MLAQSCTSSTNPKSNTVFPDISPYEFSMVNNICDLHKSTKVNSSKSKNYAKCAPVGYCSHLTTGELNGSTSSRADSNCLIFISSISCTTLLTKQSTCTCKEQDSRNATVKLVVWRVIQPKLFMFRKKKEIKMLLIRSLLSVQKWILLLEVFETRVHLRGSWGLARSYKEVCQS